MDPHPTGAGLASLLLALLALPLPCSAQPREVKATVVWVREDRVYIASRDSSALEQGQLLTFLDRGKPIASGEVARVHDGELALVLLTSGSLNRVRHMDRLQILGEPPSFRPLSRLRVGYPSRRRSTLLFVCPRMTVTPPFFPHAYRTDASSQDSYRWVRDSAAVDRGVWPDTLLVRLYDEAADQEIALERGELDVAVFWPGELSARLRQVRRWQSDMFGARSRGVIAAKWQGGMSPPDSGAAPPDTLDLSLLNEQLFRGDLRPWPRAAVLARPGPPSGERGDVRFSVDPALPGQRALEHFLNRGMKPNPTADDRRTVRLLCLDLSITSPDSLDRRLREQGMVPLFTIRCPVVCGPELRPYVKALGADVLANLPVCDPADREP